MCSSSLTCSTPYRLAGEGEEQARGQGMDAIVAEIMRLVPSKPRQPGGAFLFAVDHCFSIRGQGTVLTGTVLQVDFCPLPLACLGHVGLLHMPYCRDVCAGELAMAGVPCREMMLSRESGCAQMKVRL